MKGPRVVLPNMISTGCGSYRPAHPRPFDVCFLTKYMTCMKMQPSLCNRNALFGRVFTSAVSACALYSLVKVMFVALASHLSIEYLSMREAMLCLCMTAVIGRRVDTVATRSRGYGGSAGHRIGVDAASKQRPGHARPRRRVTVSKMQMCAGSSGLEKPWARLNGWGRWTR